MERRRALRVAMWPGGPVFVVGAQIVNVSPYGMLIHSPLPLGPESVHRFRLVIAKVPRDVEARVAACSREGRHRYGVGLEFVGATEDLRDRLAHALKPLPADV